jgi:hypothetical protein
VIDRSRHVWPWCRKRPILRTCAHALRSPRGLSPSRCHVVRWPSPRSRARRLHLRSRSRVRLWFGLRTGPWPCDLGSSGARTIASRGFTGQGPTSVRQRRLSLREGFTPTRSARAPPVARSLLHRLETPMSPGATCQRSSRITAFHDHAARPDPREGSQFVCPQWPACARPPGRRVTRTTPARMARTPPGAKGCITRPSAKKSRMNHTRGAFHR